MRQISNVGTSPICSTFWEKDIEPIAQTETPAQQLKREASEAAESIENPETVKEALAKAAAESVAKKTEDARRDLNGKTCILVVATLQDKTNADRLQNILEKEGYDVYYVQKNGHQVGIEFKYSKYAEVQDKIKALQKITGEQQIWIKKK